MPHITSKMQLFLKRGSIYGHAENEGLNRTPFYRAIYVLDSTGIGTDFGHDLKMFGQNSYQQLTGRVISCN